MLAPLAASIGQAVISSVVKGISGGTSIEELEMQEENIWIKRFVSGSSLKQYQDYY